MINKPPYSNKKKTTDEFIAQAKQIWGDKYDYSKVDYQGSNVKVCIICPKHGEFWMTPNKHVSSKQGCPKCSESHMERDVDLYLKNVNIDFVREERFQWLVDKSYLPLDFYLPDYKVAIECQGDQHFRSYDAWGGDLMLQSVQRRDIIKNKLCKKHNIKLFYLVPKACFINCLTIYSKENTFTDIETLISKIKSLKENTLFHNIIKEILND